MISFARFTLSLTLIFSSVDLLAQQSAKIGDHPLSGIPLRSIGPALTSGRVSDFAFHPEQKEIFYAAMASAGLWKTTNNGITWQHVFKNEGSYATGVVVLNPGNPEIVWLGSGENNSQRSVGFGDGVYRSLDGGEHWENMGLKDSGHISMIRFHPEDSQVIYVAAQGPLWNSGGQRGLYRSVDGGLQWERILHIDDDTGVNEFLIDSGNPEVILASSYQRRRHVWTLINGGPGSGIHKSFDGGKTWKEITHGLPKNGMGRIGLASAPSNSSIVYAIVEANDKEKGVYRSDDFGEHWVKQSSRMTSSPQYYNELFVDPNNPDRLYSVDTFTSKSEDGGKTWDKLSFENKHVDDHVVWIDPDNSAHLYIGGDGGIYESWDMGQKWRHVRNLPTAQFYRGTPDNDHPFYNVCGGTQDNQTLCGPARNIFTDGITNSDWWIAQFGDGFKAQIDPTDANIVYAQYQHGGLTRFDKSTGQRLSITPQPPSGVKNYNWNWNAPLIISPHDHKRLYFGSEILFRSDDRGESWQAVSGDLSRNIDRNQLPVMGRVWSVDAIAKNASTSTYGAMIALDESPLREGLLYAGTDDGLIHTSSDGGENWSTVDQFKSVPDMSLIEDLVASRHDEDRAYAVIDNHKRGDHKPYVLKTSDRGKSWTLISSNLPARGSAHTIVEDHLDADLLFVGTEFGLYFTQDGGDRWHELIDLPTIAVRDLEIQRRENDLVISTFGLGFYILDDISPLRRPASTLEKSASLFQPRDSWIYIQDSRRGWGGKGDYGIGRYSGDNPGYGVTLSYYLAEDILSQKQQRQKSESKKLKNGENTPYPAWDQLRLEDNEELPQVILTISDDSGNIIRRINGPTEKGFHRVTWDMRYPAPEPIDFKETEHLPWAVPPVGVLNGPGQYQVSLSKRQNGELIKLAGPQSFGLKPLFTGGLVTSDEDARLKFELALAESYRKAKGAERAMAELQNRIDHLIKALDETPNDMENLAQNARAMDARLKILSINLKGDTALSSRAEQIPLAIVPRITFLLEGAWESQAAVTPNYRDSLEVADRELGELIGDMQQLDQDLAELEKTAEAAGAPWTPGRIPGAVG